MPEVSEERLVWQAERKLTWEDFRGVPNRLDSYVASTNSGVSFSFSYKEDETGRSIDYTVQSNFYPQLSWYRPERVNDYILAHEQTHFDISELHARKLRKALDGVKEAADFREQAETVYNQIEMERRNMQLQYDRETDHSNIREEEYRWRQFVNEQLEVYDLWK